MGRRFTFVVRAFSVLDGIGKGLDPKFDISLIAKPYALELLRFRQAGVELVIRVRHALARMPACLR